MCSKANRDASRLKNDMSVNLLPAVDDSNVRTLQSDAPQTSALEDAPVVGAPPKRAKETETKLNSSANCTEEERQAYFVKSEVLGAYTPLMFRWDASNISIEERDKLLSTVNEGRTFPSSHMSTGEVGARIYGTTRQHVPFMLPLKTYVPADVKSVKLNFDAGTQAMSQTKLAEFLSRKPSERLPASCGDEGVFYETLSQDSVQRQLKYKLGGSQFTSLRAHVVVFSARIVQATNTSQSDFTVRLEVADLNYKTNATAKHFRSLHTAQGITSNGPKVRGEGVPEPATFGSPTPPAFVSRYDATGALRLADDPALVAYAAALAAYKIEAAKSVNPLTSYLPLASVEDENASTFGVVIPSGTRGALDTGYAGATLSGLAAPRQVDMSLLYRLDANAFNTPEARRWTTLSLDQIVKELQNFVRLGSSDEVRIPEPTGAEAQHPTSGVSLILISYLAELLATSAELGKPQPERFRSGANSAQFVWVISYAAFLATASMLHARYAHFGINMNSPLRLAWTPVHGVQDLRTNGAMQDARNIWSPVTLSATVEIVFISSSSIETLSDASIASLIDPCVEWEKEYILERTEFYNKFHVTGTMTSTPPPTMPTPVQAYQEDAPVIVLRADPVAHTITKTVTTVDHEIPPPAALTIAPPPLASPNASGALGGVSSSPKEAALELEIEKLRKQALDAKLRKAAKKAAASKPTLVEEVRSALHIRPSVKA